MSLSKRGLEGPLERYGTQKKETVEDEHAESANLCNENSCANVLVRDGAFSVPHGCRVSELSHCRALLCAEGLLHGSI